MAIVKSLSRTRQCRFPTDALYLLPIPRAGHGSAVSLQMLSTCYQPRAWKGNPLTND